VRSAISAWVRGASDERLERTVGSRVSLALLFGAMARRFVPEKARGFTGAIQFRLRTQDGGVREWVVEIDGEGAGARAGRVVYPRVMLSLALADFARLAAGELDAGRALLTGKLEIEGDAAVAARLGDMFGRISSD
jgi:putative sterol carrier protein